MYTFSYNYIVDEIGLYSLILFTYIIIISIDLLFICVFRFCNVCAEKTDSDPATTVCELCSNTGGAYYPTDKSGKWVHALCSYWIPELYMSKIKGVSVTMLTNLDKKRFKLKCSLCTLKGACIQCCYGRCATAAHPYCVFHRPQGFTKRVVKNEDGEMLWEVRHSVFVIIYTIYIIYL